MRRPLALLLAVAALATAAAGCGTSTSGKNPLDDALGYMPKSTAVVVAIKTDLKDDQYKQLGALLDKFPFASQIKAAFENRLTSGSNGFNFNKDVKPLLGNDLVVGLPSGAGGLQQGTYVVAWQTKGGDPKGLIAKTSKKVGDVAGATVYQDTDGTYDALKGKTVIASKTRPLLDAALNARSASGRMTEGDFNGALGGVRKDALVRVEGDIQKLLTAPKAALAKKVPWVGGLGTFGATVASDSDGIAIDFNIKTTGVTGSQLPLAAGSTAPPVVRRPGEVGVGVRNPAQIVKFAEQAVGIVNPKGLLGKNRVSKQLGIDIDKDVVAQLGGDSAASFALDGSYALRADVKDPTALRKTLATATRNLPRAQRAEGKPASRVLHGPHGLYIVTKPGGKPVVLGVVGKELVLASDPSRAQEFAAQSATPVAGAKGSLSLAADPRSIADAILKKRGGAAAVLGASFSAPLKDLSGYVDTETSGLTGHLKLTIR